MRNSGKLIEAEKNKEGCISGGIDVWQFNNSNNSETSQAKQFDNDYTSIHPYLYTSKLAFTLAEVLITLGIIGVVASMTMPVLVQNYKKHVVETKLAKFYSLMNQAIKLSVSANGEIQYWENWTDEDSAKLWNEKYFLPYLKIIKTEYAYIGFKGTSGMPSIVNYLPDGSLFIYGESVLFFPSVKDFSIAVVKKEDSGANVDYNYPDTSTSGTKWFTFKINKNGNELFSPYGDKISNIETIKFGNNGCYKEGNNVERAYCARLIQMNGWKIPKDYQLRF